MSQTQGLQKIRLCLNTGYTSIQMVIELETDPVDLTVMQVEENSDGIG